MLSVDQTGKDVSGGSVDSNVTGRSEGYWATPGASPRIARIPVLELTHCIEENACGLGSVDLAPRCPVDMIDVEAAATLGLVSCAPGDGEIAPNFASDRSALTAALATVRPFTVENLCIRHMRNISAMARIELSHNWLPHLHVTVESFVSPKPAPLASLGEDALLWRLS